MTVIVVAGGLATAFTGSVAPLASAALLAAVGAGAGIARQRWW